MKLVAIVGSNRKDSYNKKLANFMKEHYKSDIEIDILPIEAVPMYNQDTESPPHESVLAIENAILRCDGVIIATPEYNHSITGVLSNLLDWLSRGQKSLAQKPVMIVGASMGALGTVKAQIHLRQILNSGGISAYTLPGNEVFIGGIHHKINTQGKLIDESTIKFLDSVMVNFEQWIHNTKAFK